jgi:hypothetical protein
MTVIVYDRQLNQVDFAYLPLLNSRFALALSRAFRLTLARRRRRRKRLNCETSAVFKTSEVYCKWFERKMDV